MADLDKTNILIVDDLPEKLLVYESILSELGQNLVMVHSGTEALRQVLLRDFAVILLDVNMPGMDGLETAQLIRTRKRSAHTPIIFVTAFLDDLRALEGYSHGAVDYILAPVAPEILRAKIKVFIDLFRMTEQVKRQAEERVALAEERAKRAAAEEAKRQAAFLAEASTILANSLDLETVLRGLARLVVPFLADLSVVCLADEQGAPTRMEAAWAEPGRDVHVHSTGKLQQFSPTLIAAMDRVLKTGKLEVLEGIEPITLAEVHDVSSNGTPASFPEVMLESAAVLPLAARGKVLGALALAQRRTGRTLPQSLPLVEDLTSRAGIALDNALLVRNIQESDRRKDEFLAMLAHELRNPLAPIYNAAQLIRLLGPPDPHLQEARDVIDRQLQHLSRLVDDLLDVSRLTTGKIRLQLEPLDVLTAVTNSVETSRPLIDRRKHTFEMILPSEPGKVLADPDRLSQVLSNLLNNAAKYTEVGGHIWLIVEHEASEVIFRVRDTGTGIAPEMLPRVFDLFTQADQSLDRSQGGLGIGLTLVRRLVEMHQGTVQAFSPGVGLGSEFVVRLPAFRSGEPRHHGNGVAAAGQAPRGHCRVLVVDDNVDTAESLARLVRLDGHEVRTAHDGLSALQVADIFHPEVVLLDIGLPKMDGYEVARRLREQPRFDHLLLTAITGYDQEEDHVRSEQAGFNHHLVKPVRLESLRQLLAARSPQR